jgi:hypothetical protein
MGRARTRMKEMVKREFAESEEGLIHRMIQ